jgi:HEAT repeat protein
VNDLIAQLKLYDWGGDRGALAGIDQRIVGAHGDKKELRKIERGLLEVLRSDAPAPAKEYACRQLGLIGTGRSVPALAEMLHDPEVSDCARFALEAIPDGSADRALRRALDKADGDQRVGIVNTLGERRDRKAIPLLTKMRNSPDRELSAAVEAALRKIHSSAAPRERGRLARD